MPDSSRSYQPNIRIEVVQQHMFFRYWALSVYKPIHVHMHMRMYIRTCMHTVSPKINPNI